MDKAGERLADYATNTIGEMQRVSFTITATKQAARDACAGRLTSEPAIDSLLNFRDPEED